MIDPTSAYRGIRPGRVYHVALENAVSGRATFLLLPEEGRLALLFLDADAESITAAFPPFTAYYTYPCLGEADGSFTLIDRHAGEEFPIDTIVELRNAAAHVTFTVQPLSHE